MKISDMISELSMLKAEIGDAEVLISDGWAGLHYRGNYRIVRWNDENGTPCVDIGIGGCREPE